MATVFWNFYGVIFVDYLEIGKAISGQYYARLLQRLDQEIKNKRPHLARKIILFIMTMHWPADQQLRWGNYIN